MSKIKKLIFTSIFTLLILSPSLVFAQSIITPECDFAGDSGALNPDFESCKDLNVVLLQLIKLASESFKYIGMIAFLAFVVGGFMMIISFGNPEKVKMGKTIMVNAVIGMAIAFGAFLMVNFILDALGVQSSFRTGV